jgi:hypothetical protein
MQIFKIKTWMCNNCGYKQDFEPTQENMDLQFNNDPKFKLNELKENECPNCCLQGLEGFLEKVIDEEHKAEMHLVENEEDVLNIRKQLESSPQEIVIGKTTRLETEEEKMERIDTTIESEHAEKPEEVKNLIKTDLENSPPLIVEVDVTRTETEHELQERVEKQMSEVVIIPKEQIEFLKDVYGD